MMHSLILRINIYHVLYLFLLFGTAFGGFYETVPNIIVILADDLGWNDVGFHGSDQIPTPNIDALAYNGIILNRHYVLPSSTPSRTAFFSGKYPIRMGMQGESIQGGEPRGLPLNVRILPEYLRGLGYTTKLIGKWHLGYHTPQYTPLHRGFDSFLGFYNSHVSYRDYKYSYQMKYTLYEGGVRGVSVLWSPKLHKAARVCDNLVHISDWLPTLYAAAEGDLRDLGEIDGMNQWPMLDKDEPTVRDRLLLNIDEISTTEGAIFKHYKLLRGSIENGHYDGYHRDYERNYTPHTWRYYNDSRKSTHEYVPPYYEAILNSTVSQSIKYHLGGPVTQPSTIMQLRQDATVNCRSNASLYNFITCNVTECLFDIKNDPCETKNVVNQYPRIARELDQILENYSRSIAIQVKPPVDWLADPRRTNNTWEPWIPSGDGTYLYNAAAQLAGLACYLHIGIVLVAVVCKAFV
ncbi:PREDICTED: arylsulfatase B-like [Wasmannia auropunctata]|uniref:arylsulfatase B-like n=1 Tax=Wasmannia auropunctata TaxID=64793 RepID=UPI0005EF4C5E|nr:PREDICTED: arylsulfatase B-like [Wasmannia auropunctata]